MGKKVVAEIFLKREVIKMDGSWFFIIYYDGKQFFQIFEKGKMPDLGKERDGAARVCCILSGRDGDYGWLLNRANKLQRSFETKNTS